MVLLVFTVTSLVYVRCLVLVCINGDDAPPPPPPPPAVPPPSPAFISAGLRLSPGKASIYGPLLSQPISRAAITARLRRTIQRLGDPRLPSDEARAQALLRGDGSTVAALATLSLAPLSALMPLLRAQLLSLLSEP